MKKSNLNKAVKKEKVGHTYGQKATVKKTVGKIPKGKIKKSPKTHTHQSKNVPVDMRWKPFGM